MEYFLTLIIKYKYAVFLPLAIFEGPIITVIGGFLVSIGILNLYLVYLLSVVGDIIGDSLYYAIGRYGGRPLIHRFGRHIRLTHENIDRAEAFFGTHRKKAIAISKAVSGIGTAGLFIAGALKINYWHFVRVCFLVTIVQYAIWLAVGVFFGHAYLQIGKFIGYWGSIVIVAVLGILLYFIYKAVRKQTDKMI